MTADRDTTVLTLRACLLSSKGDVALHVLKRDFKSLVGTPIPFKDLGHPTVESFLRSINDISVKCAPNGDILVRAIPSEESVHIASLVNRQKTQKKRVALPSCFGRKPTNQTWHQPHWSSNPGTSQRNQLSVTINNEWLQNNPSRSVSVRSKPLATVEDKPIIKHKYELPPRLRKVKDEHAVDVAIHELSIENNGANEYHGATQLQNDFEGNSLLNDMDDVTNSLITDMDDGTNSFINDMDDVTNLDLYQTGVEQKSKRTIMSPYAPGFAVAAGRAETQAQAVKELQTKYTRANINYDEPEITEEFDDIAEYNMHTAPWNRVQPGIELVGGTYSEETYVLKLQKYCLKRVWPDPVYKMLPRYPKHNRVLYGCQVKVGLDQHFTSYPDESYQQEEAKEYAAKKAYLTLMEADTDQSTQDVPITTNLLLIQSRVHQLVENHEAGIWATSIQDLYRDKFNENLPPDWVDKAATFSNIVLTPICKGKVIVCPNVVPVETHSVIVEAPIEAPSKLAKGLPPNIDNPNVSQDNTWDVFVSQVVSTDEIWIRIIGEEYSEKFETLSHEMELYYANEMLNMESPPHDLCIAGYYAARIGDENSRDWWHRIYLQELNWEENTAEVWLVDNGDFITVNLTQIYQLVDRFSDLPRQAVLSSLAGLEHHVDDDDTLLLIMGDLLVGHVLVAQVVERDVINNKYSLLFFDTRGDDDININDAIINKMILTANPQLPKKEGVKEVFVSHINENGQIYVQIRSNPFFHLQKLIESLSVDEIKKHSFHSPKYLKVDKMYLATFNKDEWCRAEVTLLPTTLGGQVEVRFVDSGSTKSVNISDISNLEEISNILSRMPPQALPVMLHDVKIDKHEYTELKKIISDTDSVLLKVIMPDNVPKVEIFKRAAEPEGSGALISINNSINYQSTLKRQSSLKKSRCLTRAVTQTVVDPASPPQSFVSPVNKCSPKTVVDPARSFIRTVNMSLKPPEIPAVGREYFDIFVTMAANPSNFIVQPLKNINSLQELATMMKIFYSDENSINQVASDDLVEGGLYAALFENNEWYRVTLSSVLGESASVHSCDFGEYTVVSTNKLRYLAPQFTELSYQGIKAKLTGITPVHGDWLVEDCLRFQQLVVAKQLVSVVLEMGPDVINPSETVVGLGIIDTSTNEDIEIVKVLIEEKRAIPVNSKISVK